MADSIYKHFEFRTSLPIRLSEVRQFIIDAGAADVIRRYPVAIDNTKLRGMLRVYRERIAGEGNARTIADIAYSVALHPYDRRLVCCKEMIHLLDGHAEHAATEASVGMLVRDVIVPQEVSSLAGASDITKILHALAILMPRGALAKLRYAFDENKMSAEDISDIAEVPLHWVRFMLTDPWQELLHQVCGYPLNDESNQGEAA